MAELRTARRPAQSGLHRMDARLKLPLVGLASAACLDAGAGGLAWIGAVLAVGLLSARVRPGAVAAELRRIGPLLMLVFTARALTTAGAPVLHTGGLTVTAEGLISGGLVCLRLVLAYLIAALLVATTRSADIRAAVRWFLKPLPLIPADRVATMLGLMVRFIPMILEESARTAEAQRARAVENRRNPFYRMTRFGRPFMRRVFAAADRLALAMEARGYTEQRTAPELKTAGRDWIIFAGACCVIAPAFF